MHAALKCKAAASLLTGFMLFGCDVQRDTSTIALLRSGSASVCIAADVENTLRGLIEPNTAAKSTYTITFDDTSLEAFDKEVARATCNTMLTIQGPQGPLVDRAPIDFVVTPSAQDASTFLVSSAVETYQEQLRQAIADDLDHQATQDADRLAEEQLAAMVKPGWLVGRWVQQDLGSAACSDGPYDDYGRGGRYSNVTTQGRWVLEDQTLTIVGSEKSVALDITGATSDSVTLLPSDGLVKTYRRCVKTDMREPTTATTPVSGSLTNDLEAYEATQPIN